MDNEFEIFHANHEQSQEIIDWAIAAAAAIWMMHEMLEDDDINHSERVDEAVESAKMILDNVPDFMVAPVKAAAFQAIAEQVAEEQAVAQLRDELKDL